MEREGRFLALVREVFDTYMLYTYRQQMLFTPFDAAVAVSNFCGIALEDALDHMHLPNARAPVHHFAILKVCEDLLLRAMRQGAAAANGKPRPRSAQPPLEEHREQELFIPAFAAASKAAEAPDGNGGRVFAPMSRHPPAQKLCDVGQRLGTPLEQSPPSVVSTPWGEAPHPLNARSPTQPPVSPCRSPAVKADKSTAVERDSRESKDSDDSFRCAGRATVNDAWHAEKAVEASAAAAAAATPRETSSSRNRSPSPIAPSSPRMSTRCPLPASGLFAAHTAEHAGKTSSNLVTPKRQQLCPSASPFSSSGVKVCKQFAVSGYCRFGSRCLYHHTHTAEGYSSAELTTHTACHTPFTASTTPCLSTRAPSSGGSPRFYSGKAQNPFLDDAAVADSNYLPRFPTLHSSIAMPLCECRQPALPGNGTETGHRPTTWPGIGGRATCNEGRSFGGFFLRDWAFSGPCGKCNEPAPSTCLPGSTKASDWTVKGMEDAFA